MQLVTGGTWYFWDSYFVCIHGTCFYVMLKHCQFNFVNGIFGTGKIGNEEESVTRLKSVG